MATTFTIHKLVLLHLQSVPFSFSFISQRDKERPWSMMNEEEEQETSTLSWRHTTRLSQSLQILERLGGHTDWLVSAEFFYDDRKTDEGSHNTQFVKTAEADWTYKTHTNSHKSYQEPAVSRVNFFQVKHRKNSRIQEWPTWSVRTTSIYTVQCT